MATFIRAGAPAVAPRVAAAPRSGRGPRPAPPGGGKKRGGGAPAGGGPGAAAGWGVRGEAFPPAGGFDPPPPAVALARGPGRDPGEDPAANEQRGRPHDHAPAER